MDPIAAISRLADTRRMDRSDNKVVRAEGATRRLSADAIDNTSGRHDASQNREVSATASRVWEAYGHRNSGDMRGVEGGSDDWRSTCIPPRLTPCIYDFIGRLLWTDWRLDEQSTIESSFRPTGLGDEATKIVPPGVFWTKILPRQECPNLSVRPGSADLDPCDALEVMSPQGFVKDPESEFVAGAVRVPSILAGWPDSWMVAIWHLAPLPKTTTGAVRIDSISCFRTPGVDHVTRMRISVRPEQLEVHFLADRENHEVAWRY